MALSLSTPSRAARVQAVITAAGAAAKLKFYNGTRPAGVAATAAGNTLLGTLTFGSAIGVVAGTTLDWDEASATQTAANHVSGTPTFCDITTSADVIVGRVDIVIAPATAAGSFQYAGAITQGQNITPTNLVFSEGNA